jgi:hypothetical protein
MSKLILPLGIFEQNCTLFSCYLSVLFNPFTSPIATIVVKRYKSFQQVIFCSRVNF